MILMLRRRIPCPEDVLACVYYGNRLQHMGDIEANSSFHSVAELPVPDSRDVITQRAMPE